MNISLARYLHHSPTEREQADPETVDCAEDKAEGLPAHYKGALSSAASSRRTKGSRSVKPQLGALGCRMGEAWTERVPLHSGALSADELAALAERPGPIPLPARERWTSIYGSIAAQLMDAAQRDPGGAEEIAEGVLRIEFAHATQIEEGRHPDDFLRRRTKPFMLFPTVEQEKIACWFGRARSAGPCPRGASAPSLHDDDPLRSTFPRERRADQRGGRYEEWE